MTLLVVAGALLVLAQAIGIYGLVTRKADVIFAIVMLVMLGGAVGCAAAFALPHLH